MTRAIWSPSAQPLNAALRFCRESGPLPLRQGCILRDRGGGGGGFGWGKLRREKFRHPQNSIAFGSAPGREVDSQTANQSLS